MPNKKLVQTEEAQQLTAIKYLDFVTPLSIFKQKLHFGG